LSEKALPNDIVNVIVCVLKWQTVINPFDVKMF